MTHWYDPSTADGLRPELSKPDALSIDSERRLSMPDLGVDPGSDTDITPRIEGNLDSRIVLPEGTFRMDSGVGVIGDYANRLEIVGSPHATIRVTSNDPLYLFDIGSESSPLTEFRLENLTFDISGTDAETGDRIDAAIARMWVSDRCVCRNIRVKGRRDRAYLHNELGYSKRPDRRTFLPYITDESGLGIMERIVMPDGEYWAGNYGSDDHSIPLATDPGHVGTLIWRGCHVEEFWDNGIYVRNSLGRNLIQGGLYKNCGRSCIRVGKNDRVEQAKAVYDLEGAADPGEDDSRVHPFLLHVDGGEGTSIENVHLINKTSIDPPVAIRADAESVTLKDANIEQYGPDYAVYISGDSAEHSVRIEGGQILDAPEVRASQNQSIFVNRGHVVLDGVSWVGDPAPDGTEGDAYRSFLGVASGESAHVRDCLVTNNISYGAFLLQNGEDPETVDIQGCTSNVGFWVNDSASTITNFRARNNDLSDAPDIFHVNNPSTFASDADVGGNFGHLSVTY